MKIAAASHNNKANLTKKAARFDFWTTYPNYQAMIQARPAGAGDSQVRSLWSEARLNGQLQNE